MPSLKPTVLDAFGDLRTGGLARPAAEKFGGAWLGHIMLATICGTVGAVVTVALLAQMDRTIDSVLRQATIAAVATFIGDTFAHPSHFPPQWAEPLVTAAVSAAIAVAVWHAKRWVKSL
jgi:uncharacterized membrane protein YeaQ/YmgE (transglycosylase-associated protein family)